MKIFVFSNSYGNITLKSFTIKVSPSRIAPLIQKKIPSQSKSCCGFNFVFLTIKPSQYGLWWVVGWGGAKKDARGLISLGIRHSIYISNEWYDETFLKIANYGEFLRTGKLQSLMVKPFIIVTGLIQIFLPVFERFTTEN